MGKFKSCAIVFKEKRNTYRGGELLSGVVVLDVLEPVTVKSVRVYSYGHALTKWSDDFSKNRNQIGSETYFTQAFTVYGRKVNESGPVYSLTVGQHKFGFAFRLPPEVPSSFEGEHGAIRWYLKVEVDKPFPSINNKWYRAFTMLSKLDINEPVYQRPQSKAFSKTVSKALGIGNAGTIHLSATADHFGYCPGETITVQVMARNESTKDMGKVTVSLRQQVVYKANDEKKVTNLSMSSLQTGMIVAKGTTMSLTDLKLAIPAVPPSTKKLTCHIIQCTYTVKVTLHVPWGIDLDAVIPVAIGTVPRGKSLPPPRKPNQPVVSQPPARTIEYRKCTRGIIPCCKSHDNFPNFPYTPETAFASSIPPALGAGTEAGATATMTQPTAAPTGPTYEVGQEVSEGKSNSSNGGSKAAEAAAPIDASVSGGLALALPPYSEPSAPPLDGELPPAYEDVLRMDEERQQASMQAAPVPQNDTPTGKEVAVMLVRFPDSMLSSFRDCIQHEQNNLLDSEEAFLAALAPQPISGLDSSNMTWPQRTALALLVFPDLRSGEEWLNGVSERGEVWYSVCDAIIMPATWNVSPESNGPLLFSLVVMKLREGTTRQELQSFLKTHIPPVARLRQEMEVMRVASTKQITSLHGVWVTGDQVISLSHWPKVDNYFAYKEALKKGELAKCQEAFKSLYESESVMVISEDIKSLSSQPCFDMEGSEDEVDVKEGEDEDLSENLLVAEEHFSV